MPLSLRSPARLAFLLLAFAALTFAALALAGCDSAPGNEPELEENEEPPPTNDPLTGSAVITVAFDSDVTSAMRAGVAELTSAYEIAGADAAKITVPDLERRPAVMAVDDEGWALLAGRATEEGVKIGPGSTALFLTQSFVPVMPTGLSGEEIEQRITGHEAFSELTGHISALAEAGQSYAQDVEAAQMAAAIVRDALAEEAPTDTSTNNSIARTAAVNGDGPPALDRYPITFSKGSAARSIRLTNDSFASFAVSTTSGTFEDGKTKTVMKGEEVCVLCLPPIEGGETATFSLQGIGIDEEFAVAAEFGQEQKTDVMIQASVDFFALILRGIGVAVPELQKSVIIETMTSRINFNIAAAKQDWKAALGEVVDQAFDSGFDWVTDLTVNVLKEKVKTGPLSIVLKNIAKPLAVAESTVWATERVAFYASVAPYWSNGAKEDATLCLEDGQLYASCAASVEVTPADTTISEGESVTLRAVVKDKAGNVLTGRRVRWAVGGDAASPAAGEGETFELEATEPEGEVTVTATVGQAEGESIVLIEEQHFELTGRWKLYFYRDDLRTDLIQINFIDFGEGGYGPHPEIRRWYSYNGEYKESPAAHQWTQSFDPHSVLFSPHSVLSITALPYGVTYRFGYNPDEPNRLIGRCAFGPCVELKPE